MHGSEHLQDFLIILIAAVAVVSLFRRLRASAVLGYLVAGALIGPNGLALLQDVAATAVLGQLGVVFLLFGAMNYYTHIGMYYNIANGTMHKW